MGIRGWVYVISNPSIPGLVKIGFSTKDPSLRAGELNHTGLPDKFIVDYDVLVDNPHDTEQQIHKKLNDCRYKKEREFFKCSTDEAVKVIQDVCHGKMLLENDCRFSRPEADVFTVNGVNYTRSQVEQDPKLSWRFSYLLKK